MGKGKKLESKATLPALLMTQGQMITQPLPFPLCSAISRGWPLLNPNLAVMELVAPKFQ